MKKKILTPILSNLKKVSVKSKVTKRLSIPKITSSSFKGISSITFYKNIFTYLLSIIKPILFFILGLFKFKLFKKFKFLSKIILIIYHFAIALIIASSTTIPLTELAYNYLEQGITIYLNANFEIKNFIIRCLERFINYLSPSTESSEILRFKDGKSEWRDNLSLKQIDEKKTNYWDVIKSPYFYIPAILVVTGVGIYFNYDRIETILVQHGYYDYLHSIYDYFSGRRGDGGNGGGVEGTNTIIPQDVEPAIQQNISPTSSGSNTPTASGSGIKLEDLRKKDLHLAEKFNSDEYRDYTHFFVDPDKIADKKEIYKSAGDTMENWKT